MKKIISLMLAVVLAAVLCCAALADEYPEPEGGKKFNTNWAIFGMTVHIDYEEEGYRVDIRSWDPIELSGTQWEYSCFYNEEKDALVSVSSSKYTFVQNPGTGEQEYGPYEYQDLDVDGNETVFAIDGDGFLTWADGRGQDGADLVFSDIGDFEGYWCSEDGNTWAEITWSDSEVGDEYGYNVFLHDGDEEIFDEFTTHGLYDAKTGKLTVTGSAVINRRNAEGGYDTEVVEPDPEIPIELIFSNLGNGRILLERENGTELVYDFLGGDSQG